MSPGLGELPSCKAKLGCLQRVARRQEWLEQRAKARAMVPLVTLGTPAPQISLPGHTLALDLSKSTSLGIRLVRILLMEQPWQRKPTVFIVVGLKPFTWMKQNSSLAPAFFLVHVTRCLRTCWIAVLSHHTSHPRASRLWISQTPKQMI